MQYINIINYLNQYKLVKQIIYCKYFKDNFIFQPRGCHLYLKQEAGIFQPLKTEMPILSSENAPGIILASGIMKNPNENQIASFMSFNSGVDWKKVSYELLIVIILSYFSEQLFNNQIFYGFLNHYVENIKKSQIYS